MAADQPDPVAQFRNYLESRDALVGQVAPEGAKEAHIDEAEIAAAGGYDLQLLCLGASALRDQALHDLNIAQSFLDRTLPESALSPARSAGSAALEGNVRAAQAPALAEHISERAQRLFKGVIGVEGIAGFVTIARHMTEPRLQSLSEVQALITSVYETESINLPVNIERTVVNPLIQIGVIEKVGVGTSTQYKIVPLNEREQAPLQHRINPPRVYMTMNETNLLASWLVRQRESLVNEGMPGLDDAVVAVLNDVAPGGPLGLTNEELRTIRRGAAEKIELLMGSVKLRWALSISLAPDDPRQRFIQYLNEVAQYFLSLGTKQQPQARQRWQELVR